MAAIKSQAIRIEYGAANNGLHEIISQRHFSSKCQWTEKFVDPNYLVNQNKKNNVETTVKELSYLDNGYENWQPEGIY